MLPGIKKRVVSFSDIMMYVAVGMKYSRLIVLLFCASLLAGLTYYVYAKPVYYGTAIIQYRPVPLPVDSQTLYRDSSDQAILADLGSTTIIGRTAYRLGYRGDEREIESRFIRKVQVSFDNHRNIVIAVWPYRPEVVAPWGQAMLSEYLALREERRKSYREATLRTFTNEMANISKRMQDHLAARTNFKETNEVTSVILKLNELSAVPVQLIMVEQKLTARERIRNSVDDPGLDVATKLSLLSTIADDESVEVGQVMYGVDPMKLPTARPNKSAFNRMLPASLQRPDFNQGMIVVPELVSGDPYGGWEEFDRQRRQLLDELKELAKVYLPAHPKMAEVSSKLAEVEKKLSLEFDVARSRFELEYTKLLDRKTELQKKMPAYEEAIRQFEITQQHTTEYEAGQLAWNTMYSQLAKSVTEFNFGMENERAQLNYLGVGELRDVVPVSPNRLKLILISLFIGGMLSLGVPFLFEYLDYTVNDVAEVEDSLGMRGLGIVPKVVEDSKEKFPLLVGESGATRHLVENFRIIRTNLLLTNANGSEPETPIGQQVILVASAVPKEGKTAMTANLGVSFAQKGEKTLIIDADLRRGRLHRVFGTRTLPGLSNVLMEGVSLDMACRPTYHENLDLMTCGKHINGATELLGTLAFEDILKELRHRYQKIIIDTPPILGLSETLMMQKFTDGLVFVISSGHTPMRSVKSAITALRSNGVRIFGFVLNRIDLTNNANYYNYYYYSYHYYDRYQALEKAS